jgi:hypothetical protein
MIQNFNTKQVQSLVVALFLGAANFPLSAQTTQENPSSHAFQLGPPPKRGEAPKRLVPADPTKNAGKVEWFNRVIEFKELHQGQPQAMEIKFKNNSNEPLFILEAKGSCHCLTIDWPKSGIAPGETASISVLHDAAEVGEFYRIVSIGTNFDTENWLMVPVTGKVITP